MKSLDYILVGLIILATLGALYIYTLGETPREEGIGCTMDALICADGTAVGRTGPDCTFADCPMTAGVTGTPKDNLIRVTTPTEGNTISSPVTITGEARGYWFFEASFPVSVVDWDGRIIGEGIATANGEWMTENFVPFSATIEYNLPADTPYRRGALILQKDNPSGLPEHDNALEIPVNFK